MALMLNAERVRELLLYDPDTGIFTRRTDTGNGRRIGDVAGYLSTRDGYVFIGVDGRDYPAHRLAWLYMTGEWPTTTLDHQDTDKANNCFKNLRLAGHSMNGGNTLKRITNTSGAKGVSRCYGRGKPWHAHIQGRYIGSFDTIEEAKACYDKAAREIFGEFFRS